MPIVNTGTGAQLHYEDIGTGETVIALHGLLGTARVDLGNVMDVLSQDYRVIGITMRGYGDSGPKPRTFPQDYYQQDALDVLAAMDALQVDQAHIIGYSDGGEVALIAATEQPERFLSVLTWGSMGKVPHLLRPNPDDPGSVPGVGDIVQVAQQLHGITDVQPVMAQWVTSFTAIIDAGGDLSQSNAHRLTMPVLLILGDNDPMAFRSEAEPLINAAPNASLQMLEGGHALHEEQLELLIHHIRTFIAQA